MPGRLRLARGEFVEGGAGGRDRSVPGREAGHRLGEILLVPGKGDRHRASPDIEPNSNSCCRSAGGEAGAPAGAREGRTGVVACRAGIWGRLGGGVVVDEADGVVDVVVDVLDRGAVADPGSQGALED